MPNWCNCTYKCVGDLNEVKAIYKVLKSLDKRKTSIIENGFGKMWLGNLVTKLGGDWEKYRCRGAIIDYSLDDEVLTINQYVAWCEQEGVRNIIEEKFPSVKVYFIEEESGCGVFSTNDTSGLFFPEKYWVETDCESNYFETMEEVANCISEIVNREISPTMKDLEEAVSLYMDDNEDCYIAIHEISFV